MSNNTIRCGLDGCEYTHTPESAWVEHDWRDGVEGRSLGTEPKPVTVMVAAVVGKERLPDEICVSVSRGEDDEIESWLTISDAEYLIYVLGSAIRRVTTYREVS